MKKVILIIFFSLILGCGYRVESTKKPLNLRISSIAIPTIKSSSSYLGFEAILTKMVRQEFISHSGLKIVPEDQADAVLIMNVVEVRREPISYAIRQGTYEVTNSRWLKVKMVARLIDRRTGRLIWQATFREKATYSVAAQQPDPLLTNFNRNQALYSIGKQIAKRIYLRTMERF